MKDEIKEIIDRAKKLKDKCSCCEKIGNDVYVSRYHELETQNLIEAVYIIDKLLDYITNLEQENEELNRMCEIYSKSLYNADLTKAEARIDKAIHRIQLLQMDGEICIKDLGLIVRDLTGGDEE